MDEICTATYPHKRHSVDTGNYADPYWEICPGIPSPEQERRAAYRELKLQLRHERRMAKLRRKIKLFRG